jgi:hypothetical protein
MAEQQKQSLCPRLIDYLAIIGSRGIAPKQSGQPVQVSFHFTLFLY